MLCSQENKINLLMHKDFIGYNSNQFNEKHDEMSISLLYCSTGNRLKQKAIFLEQDGKRDSLQYLRFIDKTLHSFVHHKVH